MSVYLTLRCDALDCSCEKEQEFGDDQSIEQVLDESQWLTDDENGGIYCPTCAPQVANELGIEYPAK